jgi:hypothetical protein
VNIIVRVSSVPDNTKQLLRWVEGLKYTDLVKSDANAMQVLDDTGDEYMLVASVFFRSSTLKS